MGLQRVQELELAGKHFHLRKDRRKSLSGTVMKMCEFQKGWRISWQSDFQFLKNKFGPWSDFYPTKRHSK